jgi:hypothetical protein
MNYSITFIGLLATILSQFIPAEVAGELAGDIVLVVGLLVTWWGRYRHGDISLVGWKR